MKEDDTIASRIPASALIADFQTMLAERWAYGAATKRGQVDCSGAFVWAYQQHGHSVYHGSNRMARVEVEALIPMAEATPEPGMAAFKRRAPGDRGYALPASYQPGGAHHNGDLGDYYHVGLVDADTSRVLNAQSSSTGFVASPISQNWTHVARLRQVDYGPKEEIPLTTMEIFAENGKAVNLRQSPSAAAARVAQLPVGTRVEVRGEAGDWAQVTAGTRQGYVMRAYLRDPVPTAEERLTRLEERVAALEGGAPQ